MNASLPISVEFTLDLISCEASFKDNPAITNFPISGRLTEPSEFIESSSDPISDELMESSDDLFLGRMELEPSLFDLCKAGYQFTFQWTATEEVLTWRLRRTFKRQFAKAHSCARPTPVSPASPSVCSTASSSSSSLLQFVKSFNPAVAARVSFANFMYSVVPHNISGSFGLKYSKTNLLWRTLFACAFNVCKLRVKHSYQCEGESCSIPYSA